MAYTPIESIAGIQPIASTSTTQNHALGTTIRAVDPTLGGGTFIYLKGVVGTTVGSIVSYDQRLGLTTLAAITTKNLNLPLAVAMSANVALGFGWYQVQGVVPIKKTAVKVGPIVPLYLSGTAGRVMSTLATGRQVVNAQSSVASAATVASTVSTVNAEIAWPFAQGQII